MKVETEKKYKLLILSAALDDFKLDDTILWP